jgi:hypothetical protein
MPTNLTSAFLFVLLACPGFAYLLRVERGRHAFRRMSILRETAMVILGSALSLSIVGIALAGARRLWPRHTPDVGLLVRTPDHYFQRHYAYLGWWGLGLLAVACIVAYGAAHLEIFSRFEWLFPADGVRHLSAWTRLFEDPQAKDRVKHVTCHLDDGTVIEGALADYNPMAEESEDRELCLAKGVLVQEPGSDEHALWGGVVTVSARQIKWLQVEYLTDEEWHQVMRRPLRKVEVERQDWLSKLARLQRASNGM